MNNKFKVGDRVRRTVKNFHDLKIGELKIGEIYTVKSVNGKWLALEGRKNNKTSDGHPFHQDFFEAVEECFKPDTVLKIPKDYMDYFYSPFLGKSFYGMDWGYTYNKPKTNNIMNTISRIARSLFDKDTQTLIEAGYLSECAELTTTGKEELWAIIFAAHKAELVKVAEEAKKENEVKK